MAKPQRKKFEGVKFVTPIFRASYLTVFEPKAYEDGPEKYSVEMLFHKTKTDLTEMKKAMKSVAVKAWGVDKATKKIKLPKNFRWPFKDGDALDLAEDMDKKAREAKEAIYNEHTFARADSQNAVGVFDQKKNDIIDKSEIFSGCFCKASLFMVPYENIGGSGSQGRSGIKLYLSGVQLIKLGEPLGNPGSKNDFQIEANEEGEDTSGGDDDDSNFG